MVVILPTLRKLKGGVSRCKEKYRLRNAKPKIESITADENKRLEDIAKNKINHYNFSPSYSTTGTCYSTKGIYRGEIR